jgi:protein Tex
MEVDIKRNRIALSMKSKPDLDGQRRSDPGDRGGPGNRNVRPQGGGQRPSAAPTNDWFSQAMQNAKKK